MSRYKKGDIAMSVVIIITIVVSVLLLGARSFLYSKGIIDSDKIIGMYRTTEESGSMILSLLNDDIDDSGLEMATILASSGLKDFPSGVKEEYIEKTLNNLASVKGKDGCYIRISTSDGDFFYNEPNEVEEEEEVYEVEESENDLGIHFNNLPVLKSDTCITSPYGWRWWNDEKILFTKPLNPSLKDIFMQIGTDEKEIDIKIKDIFRENMNILLDKVSPSTGSVDVSTIKKTNENDYEAYDKTNNNVYRIKIENSQLKFYFKDKRWQFHKGIDWRGNNIDAVVSVAPGKVTQVVSECNENPVTVCLQGTDNEPDGCFCNNGYGNVIVIGHGNLVERSGIDKKVFEYYTYYYHLHDVFVKVGQTVKSGDSLGTVGNTGRSTGPHLHFGVGKYPFEMPYRTNIENFYNPCPFFSATSGLSSVVQKAESSSCHPCQVDCTDNTIRGTDKELLENCINTKAKKETAALPLINGKIAGVELVCY